MSTSNRDDQPRLGLQLLQQQVQPQSTFLGLPSEILELITAYVSLRDLKSLRSASKHLADFTDPFLFHTIVLVPSALSFRVITALLQPGRIGGYVKRLVYDDRWPDVESKLGDILRAHPFDFATPSVKARLLRNLEGLTKHTRVVKDNIWREVALVKQVLDLLPSLTAISVLTTFNKHDSTATLPRFYSRICSEALCDFDKAMLRPSQPVFTRSGQSVLSAIGQSAKHLTDLDVSGFGWCCMFMDPSPLYVWPTEALATLKHLDLSFRHCSTDWFVEDKQILAKLGVALSNTVHLESLSLELVNCWSECMLSILFPNPHQYPHLRQLGLENFSFTEPALLAFLVRHSSTLEVLRLNSVALVAMHPSERPCWRRIFIRVQSALNLQRVQFEESLYFPQQTSPQGDSMRMSLYPKPERRFPGCLLDQMEEFVLYGGDCPLRAGYLDLEGDDFEGLGDDSWVFSLYSYW